MHHSSIHHHVTLRRLTPCAALCGACCFLSATTLCGCTRQTFTSLIPATPLIELCWRASSPARATCWPGGSIRSRRVDVLHACIAVSAERGKGRLLGRSTHILPFVNPPSLQTCMHDQVADEHMDTLPPTQQQVQQRRLADWTDSRPAIAVCMSWFDCWRQPGEWPSNMPGCPCPLSAKRVSDLSACHVCVCLMNFTRISAQRVSRDLTETQANMHNMPLPPACLPPTLPICPNKHTSPFS